MLEIRYVRLENKEFQYKWLTNWTIVNKVNKALFDKERNLNK